jgi:hypothetical protein
MSGKGGECPRQALAVIKAEADRAAGNVAPIITDIRRSGAATLRQIASRSERWNHNSAGLMPEPAADFTPGGS